MARPALRVRPATEADLPALLGLAEELREQLLPGDTARARQGGVGGQRVGAEARYLDALEDRRRHLVVVVDGPADAEEVLGMALLTVAPANALLDHLAVHMNHAVVADRHRRKGAGRALVAAAAGFAEERGVDQIVVSVHPGSREANRFFARLGFGPVAVRRSAPVAAVRRRLVTAEARPLEHAVRRRRRPERTVGSALSFPFATGIVERRGEIGPLPE
ncbi:MAG TPA: GNAT family N-acetyltransferase [Mycobacteriales bacterium]|jgi:ribosomal protein S18 acetylase RimI-like enzyme|nr:GNAT family N-acetyltransferase [Mycobacteriales bacterium]